MYRVDYKIFKRACKFALVDDSDWVIFKTHNLKASCFKLYCTYDKNFREPK